MNWSIGTIGGIPSESVNTQRVVHPYLKKGGVNPDGDGLDDDENYTKYVSNHLTANRDVVFVGDTGCPSDCTSPPNESTFSPTPKGSFPQSLFQSVSARVRESTW